MADHEHGKMNVEVQEKTFAGFTKTVGWASIIILLFLVFLAMVNG